LVGEGGGGGGGPYLGTAKKDRRDGNSEKRQKGMRKVEAKAGSRARGEKIKRNREERNFQET